MKTTFLYPCTCVALSVVLTGCDGSAVSATNGNDGPKPEPRKPAARTSNGFRPGALGMTPPLLTAHHQLDDHIGQLVAIRGTVSDSKAATILGVDIKPGNLRGEDCYAVGILAKWIETQEQHDAAFKKHGSFQTRGPGTTYTLYFDLTGKLAEARKWPDETQAEPK